MRKLFTVQVVLLLGSALLCTAQKSETSSYPNLPEKCAETFTWFDGLGFPDMKGHQFVRVTTGASLQSGNKPPEYLQQDAFLLEEGTNDTFTVLMLDLSTVSFQEKDKKTKLSGKVYFEEISLEEVARKRLEALRHPPKEEDSRRRFGERITERAEVFVLAWGCARNDLNTLAENLYELASKIPHRSGGWNRKNDQEENRDFREVLEQDIGHALMWRAVLACGDPNISREELLTGFETIIGHYPSSPHIPRAEKMAELLRQMIREDKEHASKTPKPLDEMSSEERAAELIFQLREQNGQQWGQPGSCDIFMDFAGKANTPAHQLVAMGYAAVPQLIEALDNECLTRSIGYHRNFYFSHHVLSIGECALAVLCRISGRSFYQHTTHPGYLTTDEQVQATKEQVQAWWEEVQQKGEKQILIEGTASGNRDAPLQAEALLKKYPDAALEALAQGVQNADESWTRTRLLKIANQIQDNTVMPLLLEEMKTAPFLSSRVVAAGALFMRTNDLAISAMIREWNILQQPIDDDRFGVGPESLIKFLASCENPDAIKALTAGLTNRPVDMRLAIVSAFRETGKFASFSSGGGIGLIDPNFEGKPLNAATLMEIEALLVAALKDTGERSGSSIVWCWGDERVSFNDPRICDVAGYILATHWPDKYDFNSATSQKTRDQQRIKCLNIWRKKQGLPLLPLPAERIVIQAPQDKTDPLLKRLQNAQDDREEDEAMNALEQLGLPALPAVLEAVQRSDGTPLQAKIKALASRMACIVVEVTLTEDSLPADPELTDLFLEMEGKPLTSDSYAHLLDTMIEKRLQTAKGVRLSVLRNEDLTGVTILAEFVRQPGKEGEESVIKIDPYETIRTSERITLNGSNCHNSYGSSIWKGASKNMLKAIDTVLASDAADYFRISVRREQME